MPGARGRRAAAGFRRLELKEPDGVVDGILHRILVEWERREHGGEGSVREKGIAVGERGLSAVREREKAERERGAAVVRDVIFFLSFF